MPIILNISTNLVFLLIIIFTNKGFGFLFLSSMLLFIFCFLLGFFKFRFQFWPLFFVASLFVFSAISFLFQDPSRSFNPSFFNITFFLFYFSTLLFASNIPPVALYKPARFVAIFLFLTLAFQILFWLATGNIFDFNSLFFDQISRQDSAFLGIPRFSSVFEEPSTFASILLLLSYLICLGNPQDRLSKLLLLGAIFTFSYLGVLVGVSVLLFAYSQGIWRTVFFFARNRVGKIAFIVLASLSSFIFLFYSYVWFSSYILSVDTVSTNLLIRFSLIEYLLGRSGFNLLFASGIFGQDPFLATFTNPDIVTSRLASVNDLGAFVHIFSRFGVIGFTLLLTLFFRGISKMPSQYIPFYVGIFFTKLSVFHPVFFVFLLAPLFVSAD